VPGQWVVLSSELSTFCAVKLSKAVDYAHVSLYKESLGWDASMQATHIGFIVLKLAQYPKIPLASFLQITSLNTKGYQLLQNSDFEGLKKKLNEFHELKVSSDVRTRNLSDEPTTNRLFSQALGLATSRVFTPCRLQTVYNSSNLLEFLKGSLGSDWKVQSASESCGGISEYPSNSSDACLSYNSQLDLVRAQLQIDKAEAERVLHDHTLASAALLVDTVKSEIEKNGKPMEVLAKLVKTLKGLPFEEQMTTVFRHYNVTVENNESMCAGGPNTGTNIAKAASIAVRDSSIGTCTFSVIYYTFQESGERREGEFSACYGLHHLGLVLDGKTKECWLCDPDGCMTPGNGKEYIKLPFARRSGGGTTHKSEYKENPPLMRNNNQVFRPRILFKIPEVGQFLQTDLYDMQLKGFLSDNLQALWCNMMKQRYPDIAGLHRSLLLNHTEGGNSFSLARHLKDGKASAQTLFLPGHFITAVTDKNFILRREIFLLDTQNSVKNIKQNSPVLKRCLAKMYCADSDHPDATAVVHVLRTHEQRAAECLIRSCMYVHALCTGKSAREIAKLKPTLKVGHMYDQFLERFKDYALDSEIQEMPSKDEAIAQDEVIYTFEIHARDARMKSSKETESVLISSDSDSALSEFKSPPSVTSLKVLSAEKPTRYANLAFPIYV
jgi:hypothetical protein